jgi:hypothetical protein
VTIEEPPQRADPHWRPAFGKPRLDLGERYVAFICKQAANEVGMGLSLGRSLIAARLAGNRPAVPQRKLPPADGRRHPNSKAGCRRTAAQSIINCRHNPVAKVLRKCSCHPYWPPISSQYRESEFHRQWNPSRFSRCGKRSRKTAKARIG